MKTLLLVALALLACCDHVIAKGRGRGRHSGSSSSHSTSSSSSHMSTSSRGGSWHSSGYESGGGRSRRSRYHGWTSRSCQGNNGDDDCSITTTQAGLLVFWGPVVVYAAICCCLREGGWARQVQKAEKEILKDAAVAELRGSSLGDVLPDTIAFEACCTDSSMKGGRIGVTLIGTLKLSVANKEGEPRNRLITGYGRDEDGDFSIPQGDLSPSGKCYWVEETAITNSKQVLVTGSFVPNKDGDLTFEGKWKANNGAYGKFTSFELTPTVYLHPAVRRNYPPTPLINGNQKTQTLLPKGADSPGFTVALKEKQSDTSTFTPPNIV